MRHRFNGFPVRCISLLLILGGLGGHRAAGQSNAGPTPRFNVETTLVLIPATVTDKLNRFVLGLHKEDFRLFEDGVEQTIAGFSGEDVPLPVGLVFDTSGSMGEKLRISRQAVLQFLKTMNPHDEAFLIEFSDRAQVVEEFTSQFEDIRKKLISVQPGPHRHARRRGACAARDEESKKHSQGDPDHF